MSDSIKSVITEYYAELERAIKSGTIDFSKLHLDDNVKVVGMSGMAFTGRKEVEEKRKQFVEMMSHFEIKKQYFDEESACTVLDWVVKSPHRVVATVEVMYVKNGKIIEVRPIYDSLVWKEVMEAKGFSKGS